MKIKELRTYNTKWKHKSLKQKYNVNKKAPAFFTTQCIIFPNNKLNRDTMALGDLLQFQVKMK